MKTHTVNIKNIGIIILAIASLGISGTRNISNVKQHAEQVWSNSGFEIVGYEGWQVGPIFGGKVWYIVQQKGNPRVIYHGFISKVGSEYHIYNLSAINAISAK